MVPENIYAHPMDGRWKYQGGRGWGSKKPNSLKERVKLNWNFQRVGGRFQTRKNMQGKYGYFLEQHKLS